jgi:hypothetical protein
MLVFPLLVLEKKGSMFFFEKKNQKTFAYLERVSKHTCANSQKVFASFFKKKSFFLPFKQP